MEHNEEKEQLGKQI